jgi:hypothetical protein
MNMNYLYRSLGNVLIEHGYGYNELHDPQMAPGSIEVTDRDGKTVVVGRVWEVWTWLGEEIGL